jgi:hypothetical protein
MRSKLTKPKKRVQRAGNDHQSQSKAPKGHGHAKRDEVFDLIPAPVVVMDRDHTILNLNQTAAQAARRPLEECIGLKFWDLFDNPGCRAGTCAAAQAVRTRAVATGEARPKIQGVELPVRVVAAPRFNANHEVVGVVEVIHNASEEDRLNVEILRLVEAARAGQLSERGKIAGFESTQRELLSGINAMLEAVVTPLNVAADYVDRISKGDIPPQITDTYHGEFNTIKNNLNTLISATNDITQAAEEIAHGNLMVVVRERSAQDKLMQALISMVAGLTRTVTEIRGIAREVASARRSIRPRSTCRMAPARRPPPPRRPLPPWKKWFPISSRMRITRSRPTGSRPNPPRMRRRAESVCWEQSRR